MFIQMVQGPCTQQEEMRKLVDDWCIAMDDQPGWLGGTYGFTDDNRFVGVVRWESRDSCTVACSRSDAPAWWASAELLFDDSKCEIHQSDNAMMMLDGGANDAGFVQIMRGRVGNAEMLRKMTTDTEMTNMLHEARPDIIGATLLIEDDGTFTETISFTSEKEAREGEKKEMPAEVAEDMQSAMADVEYIDLHRPWFK